MIINYKQIGLKTKEYRLKQNLTQEELAEKCNLSTVYISNIERGKANISFHTLDKISKILNFNIYLSISDKNISDNSIEKMLSNCSIYEYRILYDVLIATKNSLDLNLKFKS